jgi:hypothetical protein
VPEIVSTHSYPRTDTIRLIESQQWLERLSHLPPRSPSEDIASQAAPSDRHSRTNGGHMQGFFAFPLLLGVIATVLLTACGGGGGGPAPVVISLGAIADGTTGVAYPGFTFSASGGSGTFTWAETGALPPGLSLSTAGTLSGTPVTAGIYSFTVTATDSSNPPLTDSTTVSIKIADTMIIVAPVSPATGSVTYPYPGFYFSVASGGSPPFTWTVTTGALPPGLMLGSDGSLSGTPTSAGSFPFTVTATDSAPTAETGNLPVTVIVTNPPSPVVNPTPAPPAGTNGSIYAGFSFTATGGFLPLTWKLTAGALPAGLTLGIDGSLTGTPTSIGSFPITVTVTDSAPTPAMNSSAFTIVINNPPPPIINPIPPPTATVGTPYSFQFTASGGLAPLVWSETSKTLALPDLALSLDGVLSGTPSGPGIFPITLNVIDQLMRSATPTPFTVRVSLARPAATFTSTLGRMTVARTGHTATLLLSGKVLVAGGPDASAELYDPTSGMFTATGEMTIARSGHTATLLADAALPHSGKVLMVGGGTQTAELYDPATGTFTQTGSLLVQRRGQTATLLKTGKVLVAGGGTAAAELYDPSSGTSTATGNMTTARTAATATLLVSGEVLIAGGGTATAELYDPTSGLFTATGSMSETRSGHTATLLTDGTVLIAGTDATAELFSPAAGTFALVGNLLTPGFGATATLRNDSTVLVAGGRAGRIVSESHASAELFAPESEGFTATGSLITPRDGHTATLLGDGTVLVTGGANHSAICRPFPNRCTPFTVVLASAELFK